MNSRFLKRIFYFQIFSIIAFCLPSKAEKVLVIGDSLSCGPFGKYLLKSLESKGNRVFLYCTVSSSARNWLVGENPKGQICQMMSGDNQKLSLCEDKGKVPKLESLLSNINPDSVVIELGGNSLGSPKADASHKALVDLIKIVNKPCKWIGPVHVNPSQAKGFTTSHLFNLEKNLNPYYDSLTESVGRDCKVIDSRAASLPGSAGNETVDGVHRTDSAAKFWLDHIKENFDPPIKNTQFQKRPEVAK